MAEIFYTVHAQRAMNDRSVTHAEVELAVTRPESTYRGSGNRPDVKVFQRGNLGVVVKPETDGYLVITVLWRTTEDWTSEKMASDR